MISIIVALFILTSSVMSQPGFSSQKGNLVMYILITSTLLELDCCDTASLVVFTILVYGSYTTAADETSASHWYKKVKVEHPNDSNLIYDQIDKQLNHDVLV